MRGGGVDYFTHKGGIGEDVPVDLWEDGERINPKGYMTDILGDRAVKAVGDYAKAKKPFFMSLHFTAPHWPWEGPGDEAVSKTLESIYHLDGGSPKTFAAMVQRLDFQIGRILKTLETCGIAKNTLVIFTSDNGGERFSDTWPHTGKKTEILEGGIKIPAIVRWPGHIAPGSVTTQAAISMDWAPTLWEIAGIRPPSAFAPDGMSLAPILTGKSLPVSRKLFWRYKNNGQRAMRDGDMKWLKIGDNTFLFNVIEDPLERANLKRKKPEVYKRMMEEYAAWEATMLPEDPKSGSAGFSAEQLADHFENITPKPPAK